MAVIYIEIIKILTNIYVEILTNIYVESLKTKASKLVHSVVLQTQRVA